MSIDFFRELPAFDEHLQALAESSRGRMARVVSADGHMVTVEVPRKGGWDGPLGPYPATIIGLGAGETGVLVPLRGNGVLFAAVGEPRREFDLRRYGPLGTADDYPTFAAAAADVQARGGGTIVGPDGEFSLLTGWVLPDKVSFRGNGPGRTTLDFSSMTTGASGPYDSFTAAIMGSGTWTLLPDLGAAILVGDDTITFTSAPALSPGDLIQIYNTADSSFSSARTYYRNGEFATVRSVSGSVVTLTNRIISSTPYPSTAGVIEVRKVTPYRGGIEGVTVKGKNGHRTIRFDWAQQLHLRDIDATGSDYSNLEIGRSSIVRLDNIRSVDFSPLAGLNYGITIGNCQDVVIDASHLVTSRHGITLGGTSAPGSIPNRVITIRDTWIEGVETYGGVTGFSPHGNTEYLTLERCWLPSGVTVGGDRMRIVDCEIGQNKDGSAIYSGELLGYDVTVKGCTIRGGINYGTVPQALCYFYWGTEAIREDGVFRFEENTIDLAGSRLSSGTSAIAIHLLNNGAANASNDVILRDNHMIDSVGPVLANLHIGPYIRTTADAHFRTITIDGLTGNLGVYVSNITARTVRFRRIDLVDAMGWGARYLAPSTGGHGTIDVFAEDVSVIGSQHTGLWIAGATGKSVDVFITDVTCLDNAAGSTGASQTQSSMYITTARDVVRRNAVYGDRKLTPTMTRADAFNGVTTLIDIAPVVLGTITTPYRNAVTTTRTLAIP